MKNKCEIHTVINCPICKDIITTLSAKDFKITIDGELVEITEARFNPYTGGYILEFNKKITEYPLVKDVLPIRALNAIEGGNYIDYWDGMRLDEFYKHRHKLKILRNVGLKTLYEIDQIFIEYGLLKNN